MKYSALSLVLGAAELSSMQQEKRAITKKIITDDFVSAASQVQAWRVLICIKKICIQLP